MIAEIFPQAYDAVGRKVFRPDLRRKGVHPTFPMGRYVSQPLSVKCASLEDMRKFLCTCSGVSDEEQFGKRDYWQPPENFEQTRKGDCDDFALWTWRQLLDLGYEARFVCGAHGRYGTGHAWVEFMKDGKWFLIEPQLHGIGLDMPRLSTLRYKPKLSVSCDDGRISFYSDEDRHRLPSFAQLIPLACDWMIFWTYIWLRVIQHLPGFAFRRLRHRKQ